MTHRRKLTALLTCAAVAVAVATLFAAMPVFAHARYKSSTPGTGEVLAASPARVEITFTEQIQKVSGTYSIEVTRDRGATVTSGSAVVDDTDRSKVSVPLQAGLEPGRYVVNWTNVSDDDGDPINGGFSFYINTQPNAVDLANDKQLAALGFEDVTATAAAGGASTPAPGGTTTASTAVRVTTRPASTTASGTRSPGISAATPIPTTTSTSGTGGSDHTNLYVVIGAAIVGLVIGFGAWQYLSRRRT
jgi:methionine-rich copper-binding protein CopC